MNESSDPHSADKILGAESHSPVRDLQAKAWADHSERERLEALWQERDEKGFAHAGQDLVRDEAG